MSNVPRVTMSDASDRVLSDAALAELRQLNEGNMPHRATVTIVPISGARVGGALVDRTPVVLLNAQRCRLTPRRRPMIATVGSGDQSRAAQEWTITFVAGVRLPAGAVAVVTDAVTGAAVNTVRIGARESSFAFEVGAGYAAQDVSPGGR